MCMRCLELSRRSLLVGGAAAAASLHAGVAQARVRPQDMVPLVGPGFKPTDRDEIGIWQLMERAEDLRSELRGGVHPARKVSAVPR